MTDEAARNKVKTRLDISSVSTFDADIDTFVSEAVSRLFPYIQKEVKDTTVSMADDDWKFTLPSSMESIRFMYDSSDHKINDFIQHDREVIVYSDVSEGLLTIYGLGKYELADLPSWLHLPVTWFAMSEFYLFLAGNKRKYNVYMQNARASVDNMQDMADYLEEKANVYLQDRGVLAGHE